MLTTKIFLIQLAFSSASYRLLDLENCVRTDQVTSGSESDRESSIIARSDPEELATTRSELSIKPEDEFIALATQGRDKLKGSVMMTMDGLTMVDHVATTLTDMDPEIVSKFVAWTKNFVQENKLVAASFLGFVGSITVLVGKYVKEFSHAIELAADLPLQKKAALYQALMLVRVFIAGIVPGASPAFTAPIQIIEDASTRNDGGVDHTMAITMATSILPNLLAQIPGFSEFCWKYFSKIPPVGCTVSQIMQAAFNAGHNDEERAGNAIALGHFTPGSGTFTSLVAGVFVWTWFDMVTSGFLGIADDLFMNVGLKSAKDPAKALEDAQFLLIFAQVFKVIYSLYMKMIGQFAMHTVNFGLMQGSLLTYTYLADSYGTDVPVWLPAGTLLVSAMILPGTERLILRSLGIELGRTTHGHQDQDSQTEPLTEEASNIIPL